MEQCPETENLPGARMGMDAVKEQAWFALIGGL
jgi:hypothetical protein